jgi:hypothetical protein
MSSYFDEVKKYQEKILNIKKYKRAYYIKNYDVYKERNRIYRLKKKEEQNKIEKVYS